MVLYPGARRLLPCVERRLLRGNAWCAARWIWPLKVLYIYQEVARRCLSAPAVHEEQDALSSNVRRATCRV